MISVHMGASPSTQHRERAARLEVVEALREELRQRGTGGTLVVTDGGAEEKGANLPQRSLDTLLELPQGRGALGVISGQWSSGKTSLALTQVARVTRSGQRAAVVDGRGWIFPPALALMEGDLAKTLVLQPPAERAAWATEQILRSGLFSLAVLLEPRRLDRPVLRRLQLAAERGSAFCLLIPRDPSSVLPGLISLRLHVRALPPGETPSPRPALIAAPPRQRRVRVLHQRAMPAVTVAESREIGLLSEYEHVHGEDVQNRDIQQSQKGGRDQRERRGRSPLSHPRALPAVVGG